MAKYTWSERLRYMFDNTMSKGPVALIGWLAVLSLIVIVAQISENKALNAVFADLFDPEGVEIYLKPASQYVKLRQEINFYTVVESARQRGQIAIGCRLAKYADDATVAYGVVVNPDKSHLVSFGTEDRIIVIAEE